MDSEENERKPQLGKEERGAKAQRIHDRINNANFLVACVKVALYMDRVKHLGYRAKHDVDDGIDDGKTEYALFEVSEDTVFEL